LSEQAYAMERGHGEEVQTAATVIQPCRLHHTGACTALGCTHSSVKIDEHALHHPLAIIAGPTSCPDRPIGEFPATAAGAVPWKRTPKNPSTAVAPFQPRRTPGLSEAAWKAILRRGLLGRRSSIVTLAQKIKLALSPA
jgi:hypothetical protein